MTRSEVWGLTSAVLLLGGIVLAVVCLVTSVFNGLWVLAGLGVAGFVAITAWKRDD